MLAGAVRDGFNHNVLMLEITLLAQNFPAGSNFSTYEHSTKDIYPSHAHENGGLLTLEFVIGCADGHTTLPRTHP